MERNVGTLDRSLRITIGIVLLALVIVGPKTAWGYLGVVPLVTGLSGVCPLYGALGRQT